MPTTRVSVDHDDRADLALAHARARLGDRLRRRRGQDLARHHVGDVAGPGALSHASPLRRVVRCGHPSIRGTDIAPIRGWRGRSPPPGVGRPGSSVRSASRRGIQREWSPCRPRSTSIARGSSPRPPRCSGRPSRAPTTTPAGGAGCASSTPALAVGECWKATVQSPLPYALRFSLDLRRVEAPTLLEVDVSGDIAGPARLEVSRRDDGYAVRVSWQVEAAIGADPYGCAARPAVAAVESREGGRDRPHPVHPTGTFASVLGSAHAE